MTRRLFLFEDRGGIATIFAATVVPALIVVIGLVADGGHLLSARREAGDHAAGAARAGAQEIDLHTLRRTGAATLTPGAAAATARAHLATSGATGSVNVSGAVVTVTVTDRVDLPLLQTVGLNARTVTATRQARAAIGIDTAGD